MNKNKLVRMACAATAMVAAMPITPVFAVDLASNTTTGNTQVTYQVSSSTDGDGGVGEYTTTHFVWGVPASFSFSASELTKNDNAYIRPDNSDKSEGEEGRVLVLDNGTEIKISMESGNEFKLKNTDKSVIEYTVQKINGEGTFEDALGQNAEILKYTAGTSDNKGIEQPLHFETTADQIKSVKLTGAHTDVLTFTMAVTTSGTMN